jgi:hypothetical protein
MQRSALRNHPIRAVPSGPAHAAPPAPAWPSYAGVSQLVGSTPSGRLNVFVDPSLGQPARQNAQDLIADGDRIITANDALFGTVGGSVSVIIFALNGATDGTGGADHNGCDYVNGGAIEVCASFGDSARVSALFEAELSECSMGGNLCGVSTGEALSRWCASSTSNNALSDFATAPGWAQDGMANWVDQTRPTDQDLDSTGCGMAFISWLMSLGHPLSDIAPELASLGENGALAQVYAALTGDAAGNAWRNFITAVRALPNGVTSDDPFGAQAPAVSTMEPMAQAARALSALLADIAAGKSEHEILASIRAMTGAAAGARARGRSKRLLPPRARAA